MATLDIFFSHGNADREWVQRITASIPPDAARVYLAEWDVQPGRPLADKVQRAIEACDIFLVLFTKHSRASAYVHQEIGYAKGKGKVVVPLVQHGVPKRALAMLDGHEYVPFDPQAPESCIQALTTYLLKQVTERASGTFAGLTRDQWVDVIGAVVLVALGLFLLYLATSSGGGSGAEAAPGDRHEVERLAVYQSLRQQPRGSCP